MRRARENSSLALRRAISAIKRNNAFHHSKLKHWRTSQAEKPPNTAPVLENGHHGLHPSCSQATYAAICLILICKCDSRQRPYLCK